MHIITYLLIFPTNKIYEGQFLYKHYKHVGMVKCVNSKFIPLCFIVFEFYCFNFLCI